MDKETFQREVDYGTAMALAREMLERGIIDRQDFMKLDKMYVERYRPTSHVTAPPRALLTGAKIGLTP